MDGQIVQSSFSPEFSIINDDDFEHNRWFDQGCIS